MLNGQYNTTRMYWHGLLDFDAFAVLPDIDCAFTFVRHPIDRIISGYYTIIAMLDRQFAHKAGKNQTEFIRIEQEYGQMHPWYAYNQSAKARFKLFVEEVIESGYEYLIDDHLVLHVLSQIGGSIGNFARWPLHFIGRMEYFEEHWNTLTMEHERCSTVFASNSKTHSHQLAHSMKRPGLQNSIESDDVDGDQVKKNELKGKGLSAEHFVFIHDKELFAKTVDYFYQDFVCFGYNMSHDAYLKHLDDKHYF